MSFFFKFAAGAFVDLHFGKCAFVEAPPVGAWRAIAVGGSATRNLNLPLLFAIWGYGMIYTKSR